jgi:hypothetical protein
MQECAPKCVDRQSDFGTRPLRFGTLPFARSAGARRGAGIQAPGAEQAKSLSLSGLPYPDGGDWFGIGDFHPYSAFRAVHSATVLKHAGNGSEHAGAIRTLNADYVDQRIFLTGLIFIV